MESTKMSRRSFLAAMGAAGALSVAGVGISGQSHKALAADADFAAPGNGHGQPLGASVDPKTGDVNINEDVIVRYSACLGCYSSCGNRLKLSRDGGTLYSVGGNPYNPSCANPYLPFEAPLEDAYRSMSYANGYGNSTRGRRADAARRRRTAMGSPTASPCRSSARALEARANGSPSAGISSSRKSRKAASCSPTSGKTRKSKASSPSTTPRHRSIPTSRRSDRNPTSSSFWAARRRPHHLRRTLRELLRVDQPIWPRLHLRRLCKCEFVLSNWVPFPSPRRIRRRIHPVAGHRTWN